MTPGSRTWVEVSLAAIVGNFETLKCIAGPQTEVAAVVKADAYGHGAAAVAGALEHAGARYFAVATAEEGVALRRSGLRGTILVLTGILPFEEEALIEYGLTPVVHSAAELAWLDQVAERRRRRLHYHFKLDTGLHRLGSCAGWEDARQAIAAAAHCELEGLMSHLASSESFADDSFGRQVAAFDQACRRLEPLLGPKAYLHLANSAAVLYGRRSAWKTMVRAGLALYGYVTAATGAAPPPLAGLRPALEWKARVLAVKTVAAGEAVGYGGTFRAAADARVAVVAAGYADGYPHALGNRGSVLVDGQIAPVIGAVSMDLLTVDVSGLREPARGASVTLLGAGGPAGIDARELARRAGTIPYVILCGIGARVARVYV